MLTLSEPQIASAMAMLNAAASAEQIANGAYALTGALGLKRYVLIDLRGNVVAGLHHNASTQPQIEDDPIVARAHMPPRVPFVWGAGEGGAWRSRLADEGFRSGVAAGTWDAERSGCLLMLSCAEKQIPEELAGVLQAYALMAVVALSGPLRRLADERTPLACPLTERELQCLLYAMAGKSSKQTARAVGIGIRTVNQYLERVREKLQVKTSQAAATIAVRNGWLDVQRALDLAA